MPLPHPHTSHTLTHTLTTPHPHNSTPHNSTPSQLHTLTTPHPHNSTRSHFTYSHSHPHNSTSSTPHPHNSTPSQLHTHTCTTAAILKHESALKNSQCGRGCGNFMRAAYIRVSSSSLGTPETFGSAKPAVTRMCLHNGNPKPYGTQWGSCRGSGG